MYNQAGVDALDDVRAVVASFGAPIAFRKLYGILNAMEMHVEETPYSVEALQHLGKALEATARLYRIDQPNEQSVLWNMAYHRDGAMGSGLHRSRCPRIHHLQRGSSGRVSVWHCAWG